jgi:hypothetical protein
MLKSLTPILSAVMGIILAWALITHADAQVDDGPLITIQSPETASTFAYGSIKSRSLMWNKQKRMLFAHITFVDGEDGSASANQDSFDFEFPGVMLDDTQGSLLRLLRDR